MYPCDMKLRLGIIGLGVGMKHALALADHPFCEIVGLCDFSDDKLKKAGENYPGALLTKNASEILDNPVINVVSIASFDNYHFEQTVRAIKNGKHVFVEKPVCLSGYRQ